MHLYTHDRGHLHPYPGASRRLHGYKGSGTPIDRIMHVPKAWVHRYCMIMSLANAGPLLGHKSPSTTHTCIGGMSSASAEVHSMGGP